MKASQVGGMPASQKGKRSAVYDWAGLATLLRENPGVAVLFAPFTQTDKVQAINAALHRKPLPVALRGLGGSITTNIRNSTTQLAPKRVTGDVWVTWNPHGEGGES